MRPDWTPAYAGVTVCTVVWQVEQLPFAKPSGLGHNSRSNERGYRVDLTFVHGRVAAALVIFAAIAGVWGVVDYFRRREIGPNYWGVIVVGNLAALAQGGIGIALALQGRPLERSWVHILYGIVLVLWIPLIQFFNRNRGGREETLMCGLVSLFEAGIALRAMTTSG